MIFYSFIRPPLLTPRLRTRELSIWQPALKTTSWSDNKRRGEEEVGKKRRGEEVCACVCVCVCVCQRTGGQSGAQCADSSPALEAEQMVRTGPAVAPDQNLTAQKSQAQNDINSQVSLYFVFFKIPCLTPFPRWPSPRILISESN